MNIYYDYVREVFFSTNPSIIALIFSFQFFLQMIATEITVNELKNHLSYLADNLPKSLIAYTSAQIETSDKLSYEEKQKITILRSSTTTNDPCPAFVFQRMECKDRILSVFCPEVKNQMVRF